MIVDTRVVWREPFKAVGMKIKYEPSWDTKPSENEISKLWVRFVPRIEEIRNLMGGTYGLMHIPADMKPGEPFDYLAAAGVGQFGDDIPEGMVAESYPGGLYAVVTRRGPIDELGRAFDYFVNEWLPSSNYTRSSGVEFEFYDERYHGNHNPESVMELWFPIRNKMPSPIDNHISSVFIHVSDLRRSAEWYNKLLGLPLKEERLNGGPVYWYDLNGTGIVLDSNINNRLNPDWREDMKPLFSFPVRDIDEAYQYLRDRTGVLFEPERFDGMAYFNFRDPEGNMLMACWSANQGTEDGAETVDETAHKETNHAGSPIVPRISGVFADVKRMESTARWYAEMLGLPLNVEKAKESIYTFLFSQGAALLLDDNRSRNDEEFSILFMFHTDNIEASYSFVRENGFDVFGEIDRHGTIAFFTLQDPDGNIVMVCQGE